MPILVIVAKSEDTLKTIEAAVQAEGVNTFTSRSLAELPAIFREVPTSGILLDLVTSAKSSAQEKLETNDLLQLFPNAKVKVIGNDVRILGESRSLQQFVQDCRLFKARTIRKSKRQTQYIGVSLSTDGEFSAVEKTVTFNFSDEGCFVYSANDWKIGDCAWMRFIENDCIVRGTVCWLQPWGNNKKLPGIGIKFDFEQ
jgi:hypothetical protein